MAKLLTPQALMAINKHTKVPGHLWYMPPETLTENPECTPKIDVFSFGHLSLFTINEEDPQVFEVKVTHEAQRQGRIQTLKRRPSVEKVGKGHCMYSLITQCLHDNPNQRPETAELTKRMKELSTRKPLMMGIGDTVALYKGEMKPMAMQREVYELKNENAQLKDQLEAAKAQVLVFQSDFADERRDRETAHSKLADLEKQIARQKGLYTEEKEEYSRQLAIAQQEAESMRKELNQANKELENHKATLASVEALNQKLQKKKAQEGFDSFWREEATKLKFQLQETEQHLTDLMSSQEDYPAKEAQVEELRKKLEEKTIELDKMTKKVNKLEEDAKSKKKKKSYDAATPGPASQESTDARNFARIEQLYNDASLELQEIHKELATWQVRYTQLENQNHEMELQIKALKANLKEQDKQLQRKIATTPGDPSQVSYQLQIWPHGKIGDIQLGEITNDGRAIPNLPIRAAAPPPLQTNTVPEFDKVTFDQSASSRNHPQRPLRASHGDILPKSNPSGPSTMSQEEYHSGNLPHQVPASTIPTNQYPQGQIGGSVADQMQFQQFPQPHGVGVNPGVVPQASVVTPQRNDYVISNPPNVQQQPFQQQQGYAGGPPDQQTLSDAHFSTSQEMLLHRMQEQQRQEEQYRQLQLQQQLLQAQQLQQQQMQAQGYQQHVHGFNQEPTYQNTNQDNIQYDQGGHSRPSIIPCHQPTPAAVPKRFTTGGGIPGTPEGLNIVLPQESSKSQPPTGSRVDIKEKDCIQDDIDDVIQQFFPEPIGVTNVLSPYDPNLVCPMCNKPFRIGEIQKFRTHVNQCEGKKKEGAN